MDIPISYCNKCEKDVPVVIKKFDSSDISELEDLEIECIFCPLCRDILNLNGDCKVEWYPLEDIEKAAGFKVADQPTNKG